MQKIKHILSRYLGIEGLNSTENDRIVGLALFIAIVGMALRLFFWGYTDRVWEDSLITVLHSENFVKGLGLTHYRTGQPPLHGFTSPLSVLVPLVGDVFRVGYGLSFIRLVSVFASGLTILYAMAIAIHPKVKFPGPLAVLVMGYLACEHHQILWGTAGMETQIVTLVLLMSAYYAIALRPVALGISLGLCMLARPDFAFWTIIVGLWILVRNFSGSVSRRSLVRHLPLVVGVALGVYLPWIVFTTAYYGSPVPNTIIAKGLGYPLWSTAPGMTWQDFGRIAFKRLSGSYAPNTIFQPLGPCFSGHGLHFKSLIHDHGIVCNFMIILALIGSFSILYKRQGALAPLLAFVVVYTVYYVFFVPAVFGWYVVPFVAAVIFLSARGLQTAGSLVSNPRHRNILFSLITLLYLGLLAGLLPKTFATEKRIQEDVENQVRKPIGLFLAQTMGKDQSVGCEPLGYIGYYSNRTVYDWPGLASRKVVAFSRQTRPEERSLKTMLDALRPDYIVLRYAEYFNYYKETWLDSDYQIIASFEIDPARTRDIIGIEDNVDTGFLVLSKWDGATAPSDKAPGINPHHSRAYRSLGYRLARQDRLDEATACFQKAIHIDPTYADPHNNLGMVLIQEGRMAEGIAEYQEALRLEPKCAFAHNNLAVQLNVQGRKDEALAHFQEALRYEPDYADAYCNLGRMFQESGRTKEAISQYHQALRSDPECVNAHINLMITYYEQGQTEKSFRHLREASRLDPARVKEEFDKIIGLFRQNKRPDQTIGLCQGLLEAIPDYLPAYGELAKAYVQLGRLDDAIAVYLKMTAIAPTNTDAYFNLGVIMLGMERFDEAIVYLEKVLALDPSDATTRTQLEKVKAAQKIWTNQ